VQIFPIPQAAIKLIMLGKKRKRKKNQETFMKGKEGPAIKGQISRRMLSAREKLSPLDREKKSVK